QQPVISLDVTATALVAAGVKLPADKPLDGVDLMPCLTGKDKNPPHEFLFWRYGTQWAVRNGQWKLLHRNPDPPRLFDLSADVGEKRDLAAEKPEVLEKLQTAWNQWNAQLPTPLWGRGQREPKIAPKKTE